MTEKPIEEINTEKLTCKPVLVRVKTLGLLKGFSFIDYEENTTEVGEE